MSQPDAEVVRWSSSAPYWERHRNIIGHMFAPVSEALIEEAGVAPGNSVLDVATGPGEPAIRIAQFMGASGEVVGVDPVPGMIEAARREAARLSLSNVHFEVAGADSLPFPNNRFDAVVSRFGIMFFPSPAAGVREMLRVLKPGRKVCFAVWSFGDANPFHSSLARVVYEYAPPQPLPPDAPDAFRFATPGKLLTILKEAGCSNPAERLYRFAMDVPLSAEDFWSLRWDMSEKLRERLAALPPDGLADLKGKAIEAFEQYSREGRLGFPGEVLLVSGSKF